MSNDFLLNEINPESELESVLKRNGINFRISGREYRFSVKSGMLQWNVVCRCSGNCVAVYGAYPFEVRESPETLNAINGKLLFGAAFRSGSTLYFRTSADLFDSYSAYESVSRALEYNMKAIVEYWAVAEKTAM